MGTIAPADRQVRVAWVTLVVSFGLFAGLLMGGIVAGRWAYHNATAPETARIDMTGDGEVRVRRRGEVGWRIGVDGMTLREGDVVATSELGGTRVTFFDGSNLSLMDDTTVELSRIRASRFLKRTRLIEITPHTGLVYARLHSNDEYQYGELVVATSDLVITSHDTTGMIDDQQFALEVIQPVSTPSHGAGYRVAALQGTTVVTSSRQERVVSLEANEQITIRPDGTMSSIDRPLREMVNNGDFRHNFDGWSVVPAIDGGREQRYATVVQTDPKAPASTALLILRSEQMGLERETGVHQEVNQSIRPGGRSALSLDLLIEPLPAIGAGRPMDSAVRLELTYVGDDRESGAWTRTIRVWDRESSNEGSGLQQSHDEPHVPPGEWRRVVFDLGAEAPRMRHVTSIVVYASGMDYQTTVTNISLTVTESAE